MSNERYNQEIIQYITDHPLMALGTVDEKGHPHGAAVYVYAATAERLYFITKTETKKFKNLLHTPYASVTIGDASENSTLQAGGTTKVVESAILIEKVMQEFTHIYAKSVDWLPPIAKIRAGAYQVVEITLKYTRLAQFKDKHAGDEHIFHES